MHPEMPWDVTELWIADLHGGATSGARKLVGNGAEALQQPEWRSDRQLAVVTDRDEWWNLYTVDVDTGALTPDAVGPFEIAEPHWVFGGSRHCEGAHVIGGPDGDRLSLDVELPYTSVTSLRRAADAYTFVGSSYATSSEVVRVVGDDVEVLRPGLDLGVDPGFLPPPELISFPTSRGETAHGLFYEPANPDYALPDGELPPLLVFVHGGPTSAAARHLVAGRGHRYWTRRMVRHRCRRRDRGRSPSGRSP
jgi:dipeptidyl aminopeptidase/acylaminoacyl peptidase